MQGAEAQSAGEGVRSCEVENNRSYALTNPLRATLVHTSTAIHHASPEGSAGVRG